MNQEPNGVLEWTREQHRLCAKAMLRAVSATSLVKRRPALEQTIHPARGSIVASPEMAAYDPNPDYSFHWLRDSAIVADALREAIEDKTLEPSTVQHLVDFIAFSLKLCRLDGPSFLQRGLLSRNGRAFLSSTCALACGDRRNRWRQDARRSALQR